MNVKQELLNKFFDMHDKMLGDYEYGVTKLGLINRAVAALVEEGHSEESLKAIASETDFPEISFEFNDMAINIPFMSENGTEQVDPTLYYKEPYNEYMMKFYTAKYNALLMDTKYEVIIEESCEVFDSNEENCDEEDNDNSEYDGLPMYFAYIQEKETEEELEDTITGLFAQITEIIDELDVYVYELLETLK